MSNDKSEESFGCLECWPPTVEDAWNARDQLESELIVDDPHFRVSIFKCSACTQQFISIFTEEIDWVNGNDPMYWTIMPLTPDEATEICRRKEEISEKKLISMLPARRSLRREYPEDADKARLFWKT